ncbi:MAG: hypothetical protein HYV09_10965 [Deltaproteobacteria bacterium]|nr:hypothetical protein [Deltaproteobacteria bacterium]
MSLGIYPVLDRDIEWWAEVGETLFEQLDWLNELAEQAGARTLLSFYGWPTFSVPGDFEGDRDDLRALLGPPTWHSPTELRATIKTLRRALGETFAGPIEDELEALDRVAEKASVTGARVYLDFS